LRVLDAIAPIAAPIRFRNRFKNIQANPIGAVADGMKVQLEAGFVASLFSSAAFGTVVSIASGGAATLLLAGLVGLISPLVRTYRLDGARQIQS